MSSEKDSKENSEELSFSTRILSSKYDKPDVHGSLNQAIYKSAAFEFPDSRSIADAFKSKTDFHTYSRISNPTIRNFEEKVRIASGAENVVALASGMGAISNTFLTIASAGANIISSPHLFGNTFSFFRSTLAFFGVEIRFVDVNNLSEVENAIDENTCAFFSEIITNPHLEVLNLPEASKLLRSRNIPVIIDTTITPWCGLNKEQFDVDVEVVSTTKYISNGGTSIGGVIVDYGKHSWKTNPKLGDLPKPKGMSRFMFKLRAEIFRNIGACMTPDTAYLQSLGLETLKLRYEKMSSTAHRLALQLSANSKIKTVNYPNLDNSPYLDVVKKIFIGNPGAMFTINLGSKQDCFDFMDKLKVIRRATNLFDHKTLAIHPESTIFCTFPEETKKLMGIDDTQIRFSVGLEEYKDLLADIENALGNH
jgi:O-acetylhomoserine (thiol)-lyase